MVAVSTFMVYILQSSSLWANCKMNLLMLAKLQLLGVDRVESAESFPA
jgi:hypothetical protein